METIILNLAVAVVPLVTSVTIILKLSLWQTRHPYAWRRMRRSILRTLAAAAALH